VSSEGARWLLVVQRDQPDLCRDLEQRFRDVAFVQVVLDRRGRDRRGRVRRTGAEQRGRERRRPPTVREREHWQLFGYRLVYRGEPASPTVASIMR
jgi:hypothetical protein